MRFSFSIKEMKMTEDTHIGALSDYRLSLASCMVLGYIPMFSFVVCVFCMAVSVNVKMVCVI